MLGDNNLDMRRNKELALVKALRKQEKRYLKTVNSVSYRLGKILVDGFSAPGKNTFLIPIRVFKLILSKTIIKRWE